MSGIRKVISNFKSDVDKKNYEEADVKHVIDQLKAKINIKDAKHVKNNMYKVIIDLKTPYGGRAISVGNAVVVAMKPEMDASWSIEVVDYESFQDSHFCELHFTFTI
jgi:hypothetical protein